MRNMKIAGKILISFGIPVVVCTIFAVVITLITAGAPDADVLVRVRVVSYVFVGALTAVFAAAGILLTRNLSRPLRFLAGAISNIAETGNIYLDDEAYKQTKTLNRRGDEIGRISRSVGDMLAMFRNKIKSLNAIAKGDLAERVAQRSGKDTIGKALADMVDGLNVMFGDILSAAAQVSAGSGHLASGAGELAQNSVDQAGAIGRLRDMIADIAGQTDQNARMAQESSALSASIRDLAQKGGDQMEEMIAAVRKISESSAAIGNIIKVIEDIAFQTNILALNASVEAARAGVHGKGFAVVADEVRNLASKSQAAVERSGALISDSASRAKQGVDIAGETAASLKKIVTGINDSARLAGEIARSSDEQAAAIARVNQEMDEVNRAMRRNSQNAAQSAGVSKDVSEQSELLQASLAQFTLDGARPEPPPLPPALRRQ